MPTVRIEISEKIIKKIAAQAAAYEPPARADGEKWKEPPTALWADTRERHLMIRLRGRDASWVVRTRGKTRVIGDIRERHHGYLSIRAARDQAAALVGKIADGEDPSPGRPKKGGGWTWGDLDREYQDLIAQPRWINRRMKPASKGTMDDVRLAFAKPSLQALHRKWLTKLDRKTVEAAFAEVDGHRQREKCCAYVRAALTWAADKRSEDSGLVGENGGWWEKLSAGDPEPKEMVAIEQRRALLLQRKADLEVGHIGELLARHEAYCAGRTAEDKISPGIRFGLWWVCYTANRRFSTVKLKREDFMEKDPLCKKGWGRAMWPPDTMKAKVPFWIPLPPAVRDIASGSIADWTQLVANEHGEMKTSWVFASTRREGRDPDNEDVSVYPNSLNKHLIRMREAKVLDGLPYFSLHLVRSVMTNFLDKHVSPVASSLLLAHTLPKTDKESSPTTLEHYLTSQRMDVKGEAMAAWSEALIEACLKAGGSMPTPREERRRSKLMAKPAR